MIADIGFERKPVNIESIASGDIDDGRGLCLGCTTRIEPTSNRKPMVVNVILKRRCIHRREIGLRSINRQLVSLDRNTDSTLVNRLCLVCCCPDS